MNWGSFAIFTLIIYVVAYGTSDESIGKFIAFFVVGLLLYDNEELYEFTYKHWRILAFTGLATNICMSSMLIRMHDMNIWTFDYAWMRLVWAISCTTAVFGVIGIGQRFLNRTNVVFQFLSERSFAIYYIHMTVVIAAGYYVVMYVNCGVALQIGIIMGISVMLTFALVEVAKRIPGVNGMLGVKYGKDEKIVGEKRICEFDILSRKEEMNLSQKEREEYYQELKEYCCKRKLKVTTKGALSIAPKLKGITGKIAKSVTKVLAGGEYVQDIKGIENIPEGPVIFASTHQGILDGFVWIPSCPKHAIIVHGKETNKLLLMAQVNTGLILVTKKKGGAKERVEAKLDMMTVLLRGHSIYICPETTWNLSPNKLHLPINYGFIDVAKKTGVPICPLTLNYTYSNKSEKERITHIDICYGKPIYVLSDDNVMDKLMEYSETISTMRYESMAVKGIVKRSNVTNAEYINYVKGNFKNLELGKINITREREGIQGAQDEFYLFHYLNDVPFDDEGNLLDTELCETLKVLNKAHGI